MARFFISGGSTLIGSCVYISGEDAQHARVLRLRVGDTVIVCDGAGKDYHCKITKVAPETVEAEVFDTVRCTAEPTIRALVIAGLPKGEKADFIVQKSTEAGASGIWFFPSARSVARLSPQSDNKKIDRWKKIAEEAAKQSGRGSIPHVGVLEDLAEAFNKALETEMPLFMYETGERKSLRENLEQGKVFTSAAVITGPEGGFESFEAELAAVAGLRVCSMGPRIFRCETAPIAALTAIMYATGNLD